MDSFKIEVDEVDNDESLENSRDGELLGMVDEGSFGSAEGKQLISQPFLETNDEENNAYLPGNVTYTVVQMASNEESTNIKTVHSPTHIHTGGEFYVIGNPVEVFGTSAAQKKNIRRDQMPNKAVTTKKRDDKRRATHNEVERRRRDKINSWITKLAALVPNSGLPDGASKGGILAKACDHITDLTEKQKRLEKLEVENEKLVFEIIRLNQELTELRKENTSMCNQLADNCILVHHRSPKGQKS